MHGALVGALASIVVAACAFEPTPARAPDGASDSSLPDDAGADARSDAGQLTCPAEYGPIAGTGRYRVVVATKRAWELAAADCDDDDDTGGPYSGFTHLLVLGAESERVAITGSGTPIPGNTWVGLSDRTVEGVYAWVTSESTNGYPVVGDKPPWDSDDPDNNGGAEHCVRFKNGYALEDKPCDDELAYVCECDAFAPN